MTLQRFMVVNAMIFIALGIAFGLYAPPMVGMFGVLETGGDALTYWYVVSFARLFGAGLFGFGFLLWAAVPGVDDPIRAQRSLVAMLLGNIMAFIVTLVQQVSIWGTFAGWLIAALFLVFTAGYAFFLKGKRS